MCTQGEVRAIVADMRARLEGLFPQQQIDAILFGSYARGDAEDGSDIDVMFLVDAPRRTSPASTGASARPPRRSC